MRLLLLLLLLCKLLLLLPGRHSSGHRRGLLRILNLLLLRRRSCLSRRQLLLPSQLLQDSGLLRLLNADHSWSVAENAHGCNHSSRSCPRYGHHLLGLHGHLHAGHGHHRRSGRS